MKQTIYDYTWKEFTSYTTCDNPITFHTRNLLVEYITDIFDPEDTEKMQLRFIVLGRITTLFIHVPHCDEMYNIDANVVITFIENEDAEIEISTMHVVDTCYCDTVADVVVKNDKLTNIHYTEL